MSDRWPLTGRGEELRLIGEALADSDRRGVVIAGQAGVGKTRLARDPQLQRVTATADLSRVAGRVRGGV